MRLGRERARIVLLRSGAAGRVVARRALAALLLIGAGNLTRAAAGTAPWLALGCTAICFGGGMANPHFINRLIDRAEPATRDRAIGGCIAAIMIGELVYSLEVSPIRWAGGIGLASASIGAGAVAAAVAVLILGGRSPRRIRRGMADTVMPQPGGGP